MTWLVRQRRRVVAEEGKPGEAEVVAGVSFTIRHVDGEYLVEGRAKSVEDLARLRRIADEVFQQILEEYEAERAGAATPERRQSRH